MVNSCDLCLTRGWSCAPSGKGKDITYQASAISPTGEIRHDTEPIEKCAWFKAQALLAKTWSTADGTPIIGPDNPYLLK
jgi:hypothetical protein